MATTSDVKVTPGSGENVAVYSISEDAETKKIQRMALNTGDGTEVTSSNPLSVAPTKATSVSATLQSAVSATANGSTIATDGQASVIFTVSGTFSATVTFEGTEDGTNYSSLSAIKLGTSTIATTTTVVGTFQTSCAGLTLVRARVTWTSGTSVTVTAHTVPIAFTPKVVNAVGDVAHDGVDAGNPVKVGAKAVSSEATAVSTHLDRTDLVADLVGKLITLPYSNPENMLNGSGNATNTSDTAVTNMGAQGSGVRVYVTTIIVNNTSATNTYVNIKDGSTTKLVVPAPATSGAIINLPVPLRLTANTALNFASGASVTTMYVSAVGYKGV